MSFPHSLSLGGSVTQKLSFGDDDEEEEEKKQPSVSSRPAPNDPLSLLAGPFIAPAPFSSSAANHSLLPSRVTFRPPDESQTPPHRTAPLIAPPNFNTPSTHSELRRAQAAQKRGAGDIASPILNPIKPPPTPCSKRNREENTKHSQLKASIEANHFPFVIPGTGIFIHSLEMLGKGDYCTAYKCVLGGGLKGTYVLKVMQGRFSLLFRNRTIQNQKNQYKALIGSPLKAHVAPHHLFDDSGFSVVDLVPEPFPADFNENDPCWRQLRDLFVTCKKLGIKPDLKRANVGVVRDAYNEPTVRLFDLSEEDDDPWEVLLPNLVRSFSNDPEVHKFLTSPG